MNVGGGRDGAGAGELEAGADAVELCVGFVGGDVDFGDGLAIGGAKSLEKDAEASLQAGGVVVFGFSESIKGTDSVDKVDAVFGLKDLGWCDPADLGGIGVGGEVFGEELSSFGEG